MSNAINSESWWGHADSFSALKVIPSDQKGPDDPCDLFEDCLVVAAPVYDRLQELSGAALEAFIGTLKVRTFPFKALTFEMPQWPITIPMPFLANFFDPLPYPFSCWHFTP